MKLNPDLLKQVQEQEVRPGNIYPAMGGRKNPGTEYWLVLRLTEHGAVMLGFDKDGEVSGAATYLRSAVRSRPVLGRADLSKMMLELRPAQN